MPSRVIGFFDTYDLFEKSIPGILLLVGVTTILPITDGITIPNNTTLPNVVTLSLVLLFMGFIVGEAVHTLAIVIEQILFTSGTFVLGWYRYIVRGLTNIWESINRQCSNNSIYRGIVYLKNLLAGLPILSHVILFYYKLKSSCYDWATVRYWGIHDVFKNHRTLFVDSIYWNFQGGSGRWEKEEKGVPYNRFREDCEDQFGVNIAKRPKEDVLPLYTIITSTVAKSDSSLSQRFQDLHSFCRSMWVILSLLFILYTIVLVEGNHDHLPPSMFNNSEFVILSFLLLISGYMIGAGRYKRHYIDYLIADFCTNNHANEVPERV